MTDLYALQRRLEIAISEAQQAADAVNAALHGSGYVAPGTPNATRAVSRDLLRNHPDGFSVPEIVRRSGVKEGSAHAALPKMPDAYIDRWERSLVQRGKPFIAVWCYTETPQENCPKPTKKPS